MARAGPAGGATRLAYAGLGHVVHTLHLPAVARLPGVTVVGGHDASPPARAAWSRAARAPAFASVDELLERARPDAVVVATPPGTHAELCTCLLERGVPVICEKPLATTTEDADRVVAAARRAGQSVAVNHHMRYQPIFQAVKEQVDAGELGALVFCEASQLLDLPPWQEPAPWRAAMADRTLLESGIHFVDLLLHLFGETPTGVCFHRSAGLGGPPGSDAVQLLTLEFSRGRLAQLTVNRVSRAAARYAELRADCELASLRASAGGRALVRAGKERASRAGIRVDYGPTGLAWLERGLRRRVLARNPRHAEVEATARLVGGALDAFRRGTAPPADGGEARKAVAVVEAAYRAAGTDRRATAPDPGGAR